jgi:hypothetical protein
MEPEETDFETCEQHSVAQKLLCGLIEKLSALRRQK